MALASQIAKKLTKATEPTGEEDLKTLKSLARKVNAARKAERRAEDLSENSPEKLRLKRAEERYDAFVQESNCPLSCTYSFNCTCQGGIRP